MLRVGRRAHKFMQWGSKGHCRCSFASLSHDLIGPDPFLRPRNLRFSGDEPTTGSESSRMVHLTTLCAVTDVNEGK